MAQGNYVSRFSGFRQDYIVLARVIITVISVLAEGQTLESSKADKPELVLQSGHSSVVTGVAFDPQGSLVASVSYDNTLKLWYAQEGYLLQTLDVREFWSHVPQSNGPSGPIGGLSTVAFMPDGVSILTADWSGVVLWRPEGNRYFRQSGIREGGLCPDPQGRWIAVAANSIVAILDPNDLHLIRTLESDSGLVLAIAMSPDGSQLASGGVDDNITIWNPLTGKKLKVFRGHSDYVRALAFSKDGQTLISASDDKTIRLWNVVSGMLRNTLLSDSGVQSVALSSDGRFIASAGENYQVALWNLATGSEVQAWRTAGGERFTSFPGNGAHKVLWFSGGLAFSPDSQSLAVGGSGSVEILDLRTMKLSSTLGGRADIIGAKFSPTGQYLAVAKQRYMALWDLGVGLPRTYLWFDPAHAGSFASAQFSPDGRMLAGGTFSPLVRIWDLKTLQIVQRLTVGGDVRALAYSPDGALLAAANVSGVAKIVNAASGDELHTLNLSLNSGIPRLVFHPDGKWLVSGSSRGDAISVWDTATGRKIKDINCQPSPQLAAHLRQVPGSSGPCGVMDLAVDRITGSLAATGNFGARLWTGPDWARVRGKLDGEVTTGGTAISPNGRLWVGGTSVWDMAQGQEVLNVGTHPNSPSFSPDSKWLASAGLGEVALWDVEKREAAAFLLSPGQNSSGQNNWLVVSPDGLFDGAPAAWTDIIWRFGKGLGEVMPVEAFFSDFYYPGLLADIVAGKHPKAPRELSEVDRRQPVVKLSLAEPATPGPVASRTVMLMVRVTPAPPDNKHPRSSGARDVRLFRNGSLVKIWHGQAVDKSGYEIKVPIIAGTNSFSAYAFNDSNVKSRDARLTVTGANTLDRKGTAYILAVGINKYSNLDFDLRYAAQDAEAFSSELQQKQNQLGTFSHVEVIPLLDQDARKDNILAALHLLAGAKTALPQGAPDALRRLETAQPEDAVFVYYAGHGVSANSHFYLIPQDLGYMGKREELDNETLKSIMRHSISDEDLLQAFEGIDAGKLVMIIDACNSGQVLESEEKRRGPMNSKGLAQLAYEKGMYVLTASEGYQTALEDAKLGHGILTYALVEEGLKTAAADEEPGDGDVDVREWLEYAARRVPEIQQSFEEHARQLEHVAVTETSKPLARPSADRDGGAQHPRMFYSRNAPRLIITKLSGRKQSAN